ncbi:hypothetical protein [Pedobacter sp. N23S346]|uniref:hypothetical protein n=1 Tax=Pedobacter sp. N23S346 TaxID=3402750 RepID=UPI003AD46876
MSYRQKILIVVVISLAITVVLFFCLSPEERNFINFLAIIGFILSIVGLIIAYIQILSIKEIAINTQNKINENITLNNNIIMLSDLSRKAAMVDEIQGYLRDDKIEMCILRMKDLKVILNSLKNQEQYNSLVSKREFKTVFENFNIDLDNFQTFQLKAKGKIDRSIISKNLELLSTIFLSVEVKLKTTNHDS